MEKKYESDWLWPHQTSDENQAGEMILQKWLVPGRKLNTFGA